VRAANSPQRLRIAPNRSRGLSAGAGAGWRIMPVAYPSLARRLAVAVRRGIACVLTGAFMVAASLPVSAEAVPLPRPRPDFAPPPQAGPAPSPAAAIRAPAEPVISPNSRFTPRQQTALFHINNYFNSFTNMQGQFIQFGPHGEQSEGVFFLSRPGK